MLHIKAVLNFTYFTIPYQTFFYTSLIDTRLRPKQQPAQLAENELTLVKSDQKRFPSVQKMIKGTFLVEFCMCVCVRAPVVQLENPQIFKNVSTRILPDSAQQTICRV